MYILLIIACLLSTVHVNGLRKVFFFDEAAYNPCGTNAGLFFYSHPTDRHKYYQCDESGTAHLRSCGELVWDEFGVTCNWPSAAAPPPPKEIVGLTTTTTLSSTTRSSWPSTTTTWPTTTTTWPTTTTTWPTTTTQSSSTTVALPSSLCTPINPCGEHGECLESPHTVPNSARRFACICSESWFGRLCDKSIDELTTSSTLILDQIKNISETIDTFSSPLTTENDSKIISHESKASDIFERFNRTHKRQLIEI